MIRGKLCRASMRGGLFGAVVLVMACVVSASAPAANLSSLDVSAVLAAGLRFQFASKAVEEEEGGGRVIAHKP